MTDMPVLGDLAAAREHRDRAIQRFAARLLEAAESGVPQREIATVIGVTQPAVSQMIAAERSRRLSVRGPISSRLHAHKTELLSVARGRGARHVRVFGSVAEGRDGAASDLDLLVVMPRTAGMLDVASLGDALSDVLGAPVDVVAEHMVKPDQLAALKRRAIPL